MDLKTAPLHYPRETETPTPAATPTPSPAVLHLPSLLYHVTAVSPHHLTVCPHRASALLPPPRQVTSPCTHTASHFFSHTWNTATLLFISLLDTFIFPTNKRCKEVQGGALRGARRCAERCTRGCRTRCTRRCGNDVFRSLLRSVTTMRRNNLICHRIVSKLSQRCLLLCLRWVILQCPKANVVAPSSNNTRLSSSPLNATLLCSTEYVCNLCALNE